MRMLKKSFDVAGSVLGGSVGEWAYAKLNGFGSVIVELQFASGDFREPIEAVVVGAGWVVEDTTAWADSYRMTLMRTGGRVVGTSSREGFIDDLRTVLSSVPNRLVVLDPKFFHPDYKQMPQWDLKRSSSAVDSEEADARPLGVYGDHAAVSRHVEWLDPGVELSAGNSASRLARPPEAPVKGFGWRLAVCAVCPAIAGFVTFEMLKPILLDLWVINWLSATLPDDTWQQPGGEYVLMVLWMLLCGVLYVVALAAAGLAGSFKKSEFKLRLLFKKKGARSREMQVALPGWSWPTVKSVPDSGTRTYIRIKTVIVLLLIVGVCFFAGRLIWTLGFSASQLPGGLPVAFLLTTTLGLVWFGSRLTRAHWLLTGRRLPRLALNIGSMAVALAVLVRLPAWAYLEGVGAGPLVSTIDWTQIISFTPSLTALGAGAVLSGLLVWLGKRATNTQRFLANLMGVATILLLLTGVVTAEMTDGYNLRVQGTSEFAGINYPVPACLQQGSSSSEFTAVWVLGTRDNQTIVTTRTPNTDDLKEPGQVTSFPSDGIVLRLVPFDHLDDGESSKACSTTQ